jgi:hypothetical protein
MKTTATVTLISTILLPAFFICGQENDSKMEHATTANPSREQGHMEGMTHETTGFYGAYSMNREASGTSWQPEGTPGSGLHFIHGDWMWTLHGVAAVVYDHQGGKRGDTDFFSPNMLIFTGNRALGAGTFGVRSMFTAEPISVGDDGYAELLQTGTTGYGKVPLIDHQHPHDLFTELAVTYSLTLKHDSSVFGYLGLPGEPALGPPKVVQRFSGIDNPEAPLTYDWLDSSHTEFGVATVGYIWKQFKLDASIFRGRQPDEHRSDIQTKLRWPKFDSYSVRLSYNPTPAWAFQASYGDLNSPEELVPNVDVVRFTASAIYHKTWKKNNWQTTLAWGQNRENPGKTFDGFLLESALNFCDTHTILGRAERVSKDGLFPPGSSLEGKEFTVNKVSLGYIYDFPKFHHIRFGVGGLGSAHFLPASLKSSYGDTPLSFLLFVRAKL